MSGSFRSNRSCLDFLHGICTVSLDHGTVHGSESVYDSYNGVYEDLAIVFFFLGSRVCFLQSHLYTFSMFHLPPRQYIWSTRSPIILSRYLHSNRSICSPLFSMLTIKHLYAYLRSSRPSTVIYIYCRDRFSYDIHRNNLLV